MSTTLVYARAVRSGWHPQDDCSWEWRSHEDVVRAAHLLRHLPVVARHDGPIVGRVDRAWFMRGEPSYAETVLALDDAGIAAIAAGLSRLSIRFRGERMDRRTRIDAIEHLALVDCARGGETLCVTRIVRPRPQLRLWRSSHA